MKLLLSHRRSKFVAYVLVACHVALGIPIEAVAAAAQKPASPPPVKVTVNRTVPAVARAPLTPVFSARATDAELFRARIFEEPLLPLDGEAVAAENQALVNALRGYLALGGRDAVEPLQRFLSAHPQSRWRASLLMNMGLVYRRTGHLLRALSAWEEAWDLAKSSTETGPKAIADRAIGELFELNASLGRYERLEELFQAIDGRDIRGSATEKVSNARQALWLMHNKPEESFRCGPLAIDQILRIGKTEHVIPAAVESLKSIKQGTSLMQVQQLAAAVGLSMRMARREPGAHVYVPSVLHWRAGHFAAIVDQRDDLFLVRDATFASEMWVRQSTLDEEASGFFLIPDRGGLLPGWLPVDGDVAATVWGRGILAGLDNNDQDEDNDQECPTCVRGMLVPSIHMLLISVRLKDIPVGYTTPLGPQPQFRITYNQRDAFQPQTFSYGNLGPKWTFDWFSFVEDDPSNLSASVTVYHRNGGKETSTGFNASTQSYAPTLRQQAIVVRVSDSPIVYERRLADGTVEVFGQPDGATTSPRKLFLTAIKDQSGNALTFTWDSSLRMVAATDAVGQVTTISYEHSDPLKITKVTDPFGRYATFEYDASGRLYRVTDVLALASSVTYGLADLVKTLTTPYGTTTFTAGEAGLSRWAEMTDPVGGKERVQYAHGLVASEPTGQVPVGMSAANSGLNEHNTLYWNKTAMASGTIDATTATDYLWALKQDGSYVAVAVPLSIKKPLENRVWYNYHGGASTREGTIRRVTAVGRVLDDGSTQLTKYEYNSRGLVTKRVDPLGRETVYEYDSNGLDLLRVKQKNGPGYLLLEERTYNSQGLPLTVTDAAGQTTTYTYNPQGQTLTVTNAKSETTTYAYTDNKLTSVTGPITGATTNFTYDSHGRLRTTTEPDGYTISQDYDVFDRPTRTTYPDGTYEETTYQFLDAQFRRDRLARKTQFIYDGNRRLTGTRDPLGRLVLQEWCTCGSLEALVDANGNRTRWERDVQGRVSKEVRANGASTTYGYEAKTSRLKTVTDAKQQVTTYSYALDDQVTGLAYTNAQIATPSVSFAYDTVFGRLAAMVDGAGTTTYAYYPITTNPTTLGATQLATVDGPLTDDTITYGYDQLGRVTTRAINGAANTVTWTFDALGRVTSEVNLIGTFTYDYDGPTSRVETVTYPNGQTSQYAYFGNTADRRLQTIHHRYPNSDTLSKFDYTYDASGNIQTWRQEADTNAVMWEYGYDATDQLTAAVKKSTDATPSILKRYAYSYDPAGNRLTEQIDDTMVGATYNNVNELLTQSPSGALRVEGILSEPATVTINGTAASVTADNRFTGSMAAVAGTNTISITATDSSANSATEVFYVDSSGAAKTFTFDADGNMTSDGTRTFEWDAHNRLTAVAEGPRRIEFQYNAAMRAAVLIEKNNGVIESARYRVWCGLEICEEKDATGTVLMRQFANVVVGQFESFYVSTDHLRSIRDVTTTSGTRSSAIEYDPFGRASGATSGVLVPATFGSLLHEDAALFSAVYRSYDPGLGRWLSTDPIGFAGGNNLYNYVNNNPINWFDPNGLLAYKSGVPAATGDLLKMLTCTESCARVDLTITSTTDSHPKKSPHGRGAAADIRYPKNPADVLCCARRCGAQYALDEAKHPSKKATGPHLHVQMNTGTGGGSGDLQGLWKDPACEPPFRKCASR